MNAITALHNTGQSVATDSLRPAASAPTGTGFVNMIEDLLGKINIEQIGADHAVRDLAVGNSDNLHGVMLAVAKADLSFRLFMEIRNRLTEAMQEIMRMQV